MFDLQKLEPEGVKRAHGQPLRRRPLDQFAHALAHFARGLVGKRDRGNLRGNHILALDQMRDLLGDHPRLARTRASKHKQRAIAVFNGGTLVGVEHGWSGSGESGVGSRQATARDFRIDESSTYPSHDAVASHRHNCGLLRYPLPTPYSPLPTPVRQCPNSISITRP